MGKEIVKKLCMNQHYFDGATYTNCPVCGAPAMMNAEPADPRPNFAQSVDTQDKKEKKSGLFGWRKKLKEDQQSMPDNLVGPGGYNPSVQQHAAPQGNQWSSPTVPLEYGEINGNVSPEPVRDPNVTVPLFVGANNGNNGSAPYPQGVQNAPNGAGPQYGAMPQGVPQGMPIPPNGAMPQGGAVPPHGTAPQRMPGPQNGSLPQGMPVSPNGAIPQGMPVSPNGASVQHGAGTPQTTPLVQTPPMPQNPSAVSAGASNRIDPGNTVPTPAVGSAGAPAAQSENSGITDASGQDLEGTIKRAVANNEERTISFFTTKVTPQQPNEQTAEHATEDVPAAAPQTGMQDPVCGWIVCVAGMHFGEFFPICAGKNSIGRSPSNRIVLYKDKSVSRERHASIVYEPQKRHFYLQPGNGDNTGLTYLNEEYIDSSKQLKEYDVIGLNTTCKFVFVPLCGESFSWEEYLSKET
ncbi:MAG: FHA domain-containing protein [Lachnospiraceae bacterium]|nr:FHA domain-containing protein [Lachnospiraceae bacterium]